MTGMRPALSIAIVVFVALALVLAAVSGAKVKRLSLTSPVRAGSYASLAVTVSPKARCTIAVIYDTVVSEAKGLESKRGGRITWRWRVGTSTHPGTWPIVVKCGKAGTLRTKIRVLPR
jgi:hypothetical protein